MPPRFDVSRSHTIRHTSTLVGFLWMSDLAVSETATCTTERNKHKIRTSMPSVGFETSIPAIMRIQTYALGCTATGILICSKVSWNAATRGIVYCVLLRLCVHKSSGDTVWSHACLQMTLDDVLPFILCAVSEETGALLRPKIRYIVFSVVILIILLPCLQETPPALVKCVQPIRPPPHTLFKLIYILYVLPLYVKTCNTFRSISVNTE
jgi:hypothetical protein